MNNLKHFDFLTLKAFLEENYGFLFGARLQKIQQPTRQELIFNIRSQGQNKKFYININPRFFHLCFMSETNEKKRFIQIPKHPPMFCMLLRKYIENAKIAKIIQPDSERILEFYFETYDETGEKIYLCLAIELMGKHSNVILYNYDTNMIIGCMHNVGAEKSSVREIIGGLPYAYPPTRNNKIVAGFSKILNPDLSVNENIDNYFSTIQEKELLNNLKSKLLTITKNKLNKTNKSLEKILKQIDSQEQPEIYRKKGDLIISNLYNNKDFSTSIEVMDYETNSPFKIIKIKLDKTKTLKENANQFYKLYNKAKTAALKSQEIIETLQKENDYLEHILYSIENAEIINDLIEIEEEINKEPKNKVKKDKEIQLFTIYHSPFTIYVGKNNKQNDYIVSKLARDEDLWFHTRNCAGSHVLLQIESGQKENDEIILKCAQLAKEYSSGKNSSKIGVIYTKAKNIKKPPGANLGYVTYKNEKEIIIN